MDRLPLILSPLLLTAALAAASQPATLDLQIEDKPLSTLIEGIARQCRAGLSVHHRVEDRLEAQVTIGARSAGWAEAVALLRDQYRVALRLEGDRLVVDDPDSDLKRSIVAKRYDIRHMLMPKSSYPGPSLEMPEPGASGSRLLPPVEGTPGPEALSLIGVILNLVAPGRWDEGQGTRIVDEGGGIITVYHIPAVQEQVSALLGACEAPLQRQVQVRLWRIPATAAIEGDILDRAAFAGVVKALGTPALAFITGNGQQNHGYAGIQRSIIADADAVQNRLDPVVSTLADGLALDVQPQSTRSGLVVACRFDAAGSATSAASLVRDAQGRTILPIDQPNRIRDSLRCTLLIPDGGAAILRFGDRAYALQAEVYEPAKR